MSSNKSDKKIIEQRTCVGCRKVQHKSKMIRVVKSPTKEIFVDLTGKAQGRGAYICKDIKCLNAALKRRQFERVFKTKVPSEVYDKIQYSMFNV